MGDIFKEQLVKKQPDMKTKMIKAVIVAITAILVVVVTGFLGQIGVFIATALIFAAYWLFGTQNLEYEYILTNTELDIDVIYNKNRRKKGFAVNVKNVELMAPVSDTEHAASFQNAEVTKDYSSGVPNENTYQFIIAMNGKRTKVIFEPNEPMLAALGNVMSPRIFIRKRV